ncbi:MAG: type I restriction endonuclease [Rikenellaceae bacterium]
MSMDFIDQLKQFSKRVETLKATIETEEATKTATIMPFFSLLGYDVFNPNEFVPEFTADVGLKKGEKVDYAILDEGQPMILIEAKWIGEKLDKHDSQLFRYFGATKSKFAILTNGMIYKFYTDLEEPNKMDLKPFFEFNILDIKENQVAELKKFHKSNFDVSTVLDTASELKYANEFKNVITRELQTPSDEFVKFFLSNVYSGPKTQNVIEKFRPVIKKSLNEYISETMNDKIKAALGTENPANEIPVETAEPETVEVKEEEVKNRIVTTNEELEGYFIVKNILKDVVDMSDITYKDTESYMGILYKNNTWKRICRLHLNGGQKFISIPDENKKDVRYDLAQIYEIEKYKEQLIAVVKRYI